MACSLIAIQADNIQFDKRMPHNSGDLIMKWLLILLVSVPGHPHSMHVFYSYETESDCIAAQAKSLDTLKRDNADNGYIKTMCVQGEVYVHESN